MEQTEKEMDDLEPGGLQETPPPEKHEGQNQYNHSIPQDEGAHLYHCGFEHCKRGHNFGPAVRDHFLIHCVLKGKGTYQIGGRCYSLMAGQGFLILPGIITTYTADGDNPWYYCWVGFGGSGTSLIMDQCGLSLEHPVFSFKSVDKMEKCVAEIYHSVSPGSNPFTTASRLFEFFSLLYRENDTKRLMSRGTVDTVIDYVTKNYSYGISVEDIARHVGVDRSHLFRIFKKMLGIAPQEYLLRFKLSRAVELMETTELSVTEVMYSCGFNDLSNFSKQFKKTYGIPPASYRRCGRMRIRADVKLPFTETE